MDTHPDFTLEKRESRDGRGERRLEMMKGEENDGMEYVLPMVEASTSLLGHPT
jgi:hypothetical protein